MFFQKHRTDEYRLAIKKIYALLNNEYTAIPTMINTGSTEGIGESPRKTYFEEKVIVPSGIKAPILI